MSCTLPLAVFKRRNCETEETEYMEKRKIDKGVKI